MKKIKKCKIFQRTITGILLFFLSTGTVTAAAPNGDSSRYNLNFWGGWGVVSNQSIATVSGATTGGFSAGVDGWFAVRQVQFGLEAAYLPVWRYDQSSIGIAYSGSAAYIPVIAGIRYFFFKGLYAAAGAGAAIGLASGATTTGVPFTMMLEAGMRHEFNAHAAIQVSIRNYFFATSAYINDFVPAVGFTWKL